MSKIEIKLENEVLILHKNSSRESENSTEKYQINLLEIGKVYRTDLKTTKASEKNKILFFEKLDSKIEDDEIEDEDFEKNKIKSQPVIVVFSEDGKVKFMYCTMENAYKNLLKLKYKVLKISLNKRKAKIIVLAYFINRYKIKIEEQRMYIDKTLFRKSNLKQYKGLISKIRMIKIGRAHV